MKTYTANKPYVVVHKDGKVIHQSAIVRGRIVQTDGTVEWFDTEAAFKARLTALGFVPKTSPRTAA